MKISDDEPVASPAGKNRSKISQTNIPSISLEKTIKVPRTIADNYGSTPSKPLHVAQAMNVSPSSGPFRMVCGAAVGYGLTSGGSNAPEISILPLGKRIVTPTEEGDDKRALREAAMKPSIAQKFYSKYDGSTIPPKNIAQNVLATFDVPVDRTGDVFDLLIENAQFVGFIKKIKDKVYLDIGMPNLSQSWSDDVVTQLKEDGVSQPDTSEEQFVQREDEKDSTSQNHTIGNHKNAIFVGHGSSRKPMEQLVKILNEYSIPHKEAIDEPNRARPIPQKVAEVMRECGAAILVFTADKEYFDKDQVSIWRPSENTSHELGAASVLYGDRIIVFKEAGVDLPSNFSSVGYIEFEKDKLNEKSLELFRELVGMKILSISVG